MIKTISILGPTASGKTSLAVELADRIGGEVVSCDSMQLYRGMETGTAAPTEEEKRGIPHYMVGLLDPSEEFSAAEYAERALPVIENIAERGKVPVICGGTGLYHDSLTEITSFNETVKDDALRDELAEFARVNGNEALHTRLAELDPEAADAIHMNNVRRVIRALEVCMTTGKTKTETDREQKSGEKRFDDRVFILDFLNRDILYSRIEKRVDIMLENGLTEEAKRVLSSEMSRTAAAAIGYKELIPYFNGTMTLEECAAEIKLATRHYAKRQIIWFRRYKDAFRLNPDRADGTIKTPAELAEEIEANI